MNRVESFGEVMRPDSECFTLSPTLSLKGEGDEDYFSGCFVALSV